MKTIKLDAQEWSKAMLQLKVSLPEGMEPLQNMEQVELVLVSSETGKLMGPRVVAVVVEYYQFSNKAWFMLVGDIYNGNAVKAGLPTQDVPSANENETRDNPQYSIMGMLIRAVAIALFATVAIHFLFR